MCDYRYIFLNYDEFLSLKIVLILANSADPDEMQHYAAFFLGLHCLPKYPFTGFILGCRTMSLPHYAVCRSFIGEYNYHTRLFY